MGKDLRMIKEGDNYTHPEKEECKTNGLKARIGDSGEKQRGRRMLILHQILSGMFWRLVAFRGDFQILPDIEQGQS